MILNKEAFSQKLKSIHSQLKPETHLLIVSKTRSIDEIRAYYDLGQRDFGENRVQELLDKSQQLKDSCPDIRWHMIGHLQSNKINQLFSIPGLWGIHSVDDEDLLRKILKSQDRPEHPVNIFLQFNTSREEEKSGFENYLQLKTAAELIPTDSKINLLGLMTMGTLRTENFEAEARRCFQELNRLKAQLEKDLAKSLQTSMGMSQDLAMALEENSNWIRVGTYMFQS